MTWSTLLWISPTGDFQVRRREGGGGGWGFWRGERTIIEINSAMRWCDDASKMSTICRPARTSSAFSRGHVNSAESAAAALRRFGMEREYA